MPITNLIKHKAPVQPSLWDTLMNTPVPTLNVMESQIEIWKGVTGYPGFMISNLGNVKTITRIITGIDNKARRIKGKDIKQFKDSGGYMFINLTQQGKSKSTRIHRLVAIEFLPKVEGKKNVNHIDGNKLNNCITNLEWCNSSENNYHAFKTGLRKPAAHLFLTGEKHARSIPVISIDKAGNEMQFVSTNEAAKHYRILNSGISNTLRGNQKTCGGYAFKYAKQ